MPMNMAAAQLAPRAHDIPHHQDKPLVLVVEDDDDHFELLCLQLTEERPRPQLTRATTLAQAQTAAEDARFDAVLLDLDLPDSKGPGTLERARATFADIPVIVMSAHGGARFGLDLIKNGAADYIDKTSLCTAGLAQRIAFACERFAAQRVLSRRNDLLSHMVTILGHDLKAPPRQIGVLCGLIHTALDREGRAAIADHLDAVRNRCTHLKTVIDGTMGIAAGASSQPRKSVHAISELIDKVAQDLDASCRPRLKLAQDAPLYADPGLMFHVLRNLIENGLTYWRDQPSTVTVTANTFAGQTELRVTDTGMGIPESMYQSIFEPNMRGLDSEDFPGTGFGLSIVRLLVAAHDGQVALTSTPDKGTTFTLTLPFPRLMTS